MRSRSGRARLVRCAIALCAGVLALALPAAADAGSGGSPWRQLEWDDFRGPAPAGREVAAQTVSGIDLRWRTRAPVEDGGAWRVRLAVTCRALMYEEASGVKPGRQTDALLAHEQRHFDITEYWARAMRKALEAVEGSGATPQRAIDRATVLAKAKSADVNRRLEHMQERYDRETDHGRDAERQRRWAAKLDALLEASGAPVAGAGPAGKARP